MFNLFYGEQVCSILFKTLAAPTLSFLIELYIDRYALGCKYNISVREVTENHRVPMPLQLRNTNRKRFKRERDNHDVTDPIWSITLAKVNYVFYAFSEKLSQPNCQLHANPKHCDTRLAYLPEVCINIPKRNNIHWKQILGSGNSLSRNSFTEQ
jgi:hypothetical protein